MKNTLSRRQFVHRSAGALAAAGSVQVLPRHVLGAADNPGPNEKLHIGGIGIGGMGGHNLHQLSGEEIVALCDVDSQYAAKTFEKYPNAKQYKDFRVMLDKQKDLDAVVIGTPDHTHAVIAMAAMQCGKHVYCQKPLTHTVFEARTLAQAAAGHNVCTQMGIQGHSGEGARLIREWIASGSLGAVRKVVAWCSLTYYPWGHASWSSPLGDRPAETPPIPESLDWDLWLGPAPERPYHPCYHPRTWRSWWDFGCGMMGDRGVHTLDPVFWALDLDAPSSIEANNTNLNPETHPIASIVHYQFPARGERPPVDLTWYDGLEPPRPAELEDGRTLGDSEGGVFFFGEKATLMCGTYGNSPRIIPETAMKAFDRPPETIARVDGTHEDDWARACKAGDRAGADFRYAGPLTETCLLGNIAKRFPKTKLYWDSASLSFPDHAEATQCVHKPYREGWTL